MEYFQVRYLWAIVSILFNYSNTGYCSKVQSAYTDNTELLYQPKNNV